MSYIENPKIAGSGIVGCFPQGKPCPIGCNQCYARDGLAYVPMTQPNVPDPAWVGNRIVRMNDLGDSNVERNKVITCAAQYKHAFFNTSIPRLNFPGPVILTVNPKEEQPTTWAYPMSYQFPVGPPANLMAVRVRTSALHSLLDFIRAWTISGVIVLLSHMRYYDGAPGDGYECRTHIANDCWQPTEETRHRVERACGVGRNRLLHVCAGKRCRDCRQCESLYWMAVRRMELAEGAR